MEAPEVAPISPISLGSTSVSSCTDTCSSDEDSVYPPSIASENRAAWTQDHVEVAKNFKYSKRYYRGLCARVKSLNPPSIGKGAYRPSNNVAIKFIGA